MRFHLIREPSVKKCIYCSRKLDPFEWKSEFYLEMHYKTLKCVCGHTLRKRLDYLGSGHDSWSRLEDLAND